MENVVSVVVPVYNVEKYLEKCLDSILGQTFKKFELIVIDDGSTDKSGQICDEYAQRDQRLKVIHKKNGGVAAACRLGIEKAEGKYLAFVDSDDWIDSDMLENLYLASENYHAQVVLCHVMREIDGRPFKKEMHQLAEGWYGRNELVGYIFPELISDGTLSGKSIAVDSRVAKLVMRDLVIKNMHFYRDDISNGEDYQLILPAVLDAQSIYVFSAYYPYHYRRVSTSITQSGTADLWKKLLVLSEHIEYIAETKAVYNFKPQIKRELLNFAILSINHQFRHSRGKWVDKIRMIRQICQDKKLGATLKEVDISTYSRNKKIMLSLLKWRMPLVIFLLKSFQVKLFIKEG